VRERGKESVREGWRERERENGRERERERDPPADRIILTQRKLMI
jgi:hypothetical protein